MKRMVAIVMTVLSACTVTPVATPPALPTATGVPVTQPTEAPPLYYVHPARVGLGTVDVLASWCFSQTTAIAVYDHAVEWHRDDAAYQECVAKGELS